MPLNSQNKLTQRLAQFDCFNDPIGRLGNGDQLWCYFVNCLMMKTIHTRLGLPYQLMQE